MGAPVVRRDELDAELKKQTAKINKAKRELRAEITEYLEERFARLEGVLESVPAVFELAADESEDSAGEDSELVIEGLSDPEGEARVQGIHLRKQEGAE